MKKLLCFTLCTIFTLVILATTVNAANYTFSSFTSGNGYGTATKVDDNITNIKGETTPVDGVFVGPFSKVNDTKKLADGIVEETHLEVDFSKIKEGELFEISVALKNAAGEYVSEAVVMSQRSNNKLELTAGWYDEESFATISENGFYTYRWEMNVEGEKTYVKFTLLSGDKVIGATEKVDMDTMVTANTKNPIAEQEGVTLKYLWFCNVNVAEGINVYATLPGSEITVIEHTDAPATVVSENAEDVLIASVKKNVELKPGVDYVAIVASNELLEEEAAGADQIKDALEEGAKIINYYDISVFVTNNETSEHVCLTELTDKIKLRLNLPTDLPKVNEGFERKFFVLNNHGQSVAEIPATADKDVKYVEFESAEFSTYALAYIDVEVQEEVEKEEEKDETPKTGINTSIITMFAVVATIAIAGFVISKK